jgi:hypothetical protein
MKKYNVKMTVVVKYNARGDGEVEYFYPEYTVEAKNKDEARDLAYDMAHNEQDDFENEIDEYLRSLYLQYYDNEDDFYEKNYVWDVEFFVDQIHEIN